MAVEVPKEVILIPAMCFFAAMKGEKSWGLWWPKLQKTRWGPKNVSDSCIRKERYSEHVWPRWWGHGNSSFQFCNPWTLVELIEKFSRASVFTTKPHPVSGVWMFSCWWIVTSHSADVRKCYCTNVSRCHRQKWKHVSHGRRPKQK